jgi:hypothetical protein
VSSLGALVLPEFRYLFATLGNLVLIINAVTVFKRQRREQAQA